MKAKRGRPHSGTEKKTANIRLPLDLHEATKEKRSAIIEEALREYLERQKQVK
jgi:hypothetical protein